MFISINYNQIIYFVTKLYADSLYRTSDNGTDILMSKSYAHYTIVLIYNVELIILSC